MALWEVTGTILPKLVMTRRFTPMRSDTSQGGDCCWAIATAVYSRTSDRSGMRRLWYSLHSGFKRWLEADSLFEKKCRFCTFVFSQMKAHQLSLGR